MESLTFRQATIEDLPRFHSFFKKSIYTLFAQDYTPLSLDFIVDVSDSKSLIRKNLKTGAYVLFLALQKETVVGFVMARSVYAGVATAQWIAVDEAFHHKGIASKLLELWEKNAYKDGAHVIQLWTGDRNVRFYKNRGFTLSGSFPQAWFGLDINLLYKPLRSPDDKLYLKHYLKKRKEKNR